MKKLSIIAICCVIGVGILACSPKLKELSFTEACYKEKPDRDGLPLSQIELLYDGIKKADDAIAKQTLEENCPIAYEKAFRYK